MSSKRLSPSYFEVLVQDDTLPMDEVALRYWIRDLQNPLRMAVLPIMRIIGSLELHLVYFLKRLIPIQFRAHKLLQWTICFFMKWFVTPEANYLILRHFGTESNLINFVIANSRNKDAPQADLYPELIRDLMIHTFVHHDAALFNAIHQLGTTKGENWPLPKDQVDFSMMRKVDVKYDTSYKKWTQFIDFETAHELFKVTFCMLLTADEYEAAINGFQLDHSIALRIGRILDEPTISSMAHNRYPLVFHGTKGLSRRFVLHGLFVEHLHAYLEELMQERGVEFAA